MIEQHYMHRSMGPAICLDKQPLHGAALLLLLPARDLATIMPEVRILRNDFEIDAAKNELTGLFRYLESHRQRL